MKHRRRWTALGIGVLLVAAGGVAAAWWWAARGRPSAGSTLTVYFTGETLGELEPCDCSGAMAGGLPARAGCLQQVEGPFLLLDTGCAGRGVRSWERLRTAATLRGMRAMGVQAMNLGETEIRLSRDELAELGTLGVPLVSANVFDESGARVAPAVRELFCKGLRVLVTGVVEAGRYPPGAGLTVRPEREVLAELVPVLAERAGVLVLLADLELDAVRELAAAFPEITLILFRGRGDSHAPEVVNRTAIASVYGDARYLGRVDLAWTSPQRVRADGEAILLDERFPEDPLVKEASIGWYKRAVHARIFDLAEPGYGWSTIQSSSPPADNRYVGPNACLACHPDKVEHWRGTAHAEALASLAARDYDRSPECVVCHVDGFGASDGYVSREETPHLGQVGCESCHGRGGLHVKTQRADALRPVNEATCRACHTPKRDPHFDMKVRLGTLKGVPWECCE